MNDDEMAKFVREIMDKKMKADAEAKRIGREPLEVAEFRISPKDYSLATAIESEC